MREIEKLANKLVILVMLYVFNLTDRLHGLNTRGK